jgi:DNA-binding LytR/AlgR family response regulator
LFFVAVCLDSLSSFPWLRSQTAFVAVIRLLHFLNRIAVSPYRKNCTVGTGRIGIKSNGRILFIDLQDVVVVEAEGNYVSVQRESGSDLLRESISTVAEKLEPCGFVRIHRSVLVNASFVQEIRPCATGEYQLLVRGGKEYTVTRTYRTNLKSLARFWIGTGSFLSD